MTAPPLDLGILAGDPVAEAERRAALRRAKRGATGLLALAALVFLATFVLPDRGWVGFLRAAAEAGMVGGLADWFAVTALFRHPLRIPVPHTALVPRRKDALAANLGGFVTGHFLTQENVRGRLAEAGVVARVGAWVASGDVADRLVQEAVVASDAALQAVGAGDAADVLLDVLRRDAARRSYAGLAGRLLADVTAGGAHRPVLDVALPYLRLAVVRNRATVHEAVRALAERNSWLVWLFATDRRIARLIDGWLRLVTEMEADPHHPLRVSLDRFLASVAADLRTGTDLAVRVDALVTDVLADPATREWLSGVTEGALESLREAVADPGGAVPQRLARALRGVATRAGEDAAFRARCEALLERAVLHVVERYASEFTRLVEDTVARWDGPATADRIELAAGRDLQFIRINGTVVGSLAGLAIHTVEVLLT